ncbi:acetyltransferase [Mycoavidus cysteinexigens]|uniref:Acetyltransferase n=1 Tax=Mycoavidus cysteinexigens TaxID=1553431 RepID=A0A2Z6EXB8_9BURK|nr:hypothetical protein [Mycoavidus cysteinexigens]BBE10099.1 acetyltransferase [Mycoavidus cysteinexigens]GAM53556.1 acetyltransferase [bacterium endosymbiont of Mortierella elongata FMR23-6]GLR00515.1 hypothetical protein GCM10007934_03260 [Mycoavidus cysteinexigens]
MNITIRHEQAADIATITRLTESAFRSEPHASHTEQFIVNALRHYDQLTISLVAVAGDAIVGHVARYPFVGRNWMVRPWANLRTA